MDTKLTLIIDHSVKEDAKEYAKEMGSSLSKLVENYLKILTAKKKKSSKKEYGPIVESLRKNAVKVPADFDYREELTNALWEKYMKDYEESAD